jgi:hypothetical protein
MVVYGPYVIVLYVLIFQGNVIFMKQSIFLYFMGASAFTGSNPLSDLAEALAGKKCLDTGANPGAYAISLGNFSS